MKTIFSDYLKIVIYFITGILLIISSYTIIINIKHYQSLSSIVVVSEIDNDYIKFKENVGLIEKSKGLNARLASALEIMKQDGVYRLIPNTKLSYNDLYKLNDYFIEELINNGWLSNIMELNESKKYQDMITILIKNSKYLNSVFTNNSLTMYDSSLDIKIEDNYHFILSNYLMYSNVILNICNEVGGTSG